MAAKSSFNPVNQAVYQQLRLAQEEYLAQVAETQISQRNPPQLSLLMTDSAASFQRIASVNSKSPGQGGFKRILPQAGAKTSSSANSKPTENGLAGIQINVDPRKWVAKQLFRRNNAGGKQTGVIEIGKKTREKSKFMKKPVIVEFVDPGISPIRKTQKFFPTAEQNRVAKTPKPPGRLSTRRGESKQDAPPPNIKSGKSLLSVLTSKGSSSNLYSGTPSSSNKSPRPTLAQVMMKTVQSELSKEQFLAVPLPQIVEEAAKRGSSKSPIITMKNLKLIEEHKSEKQTKGTRLLATQNIRTPKSKGGLLKATPPSATSSRPGQLKMGKTLSSIFGTEVAASVSEFDAAGQTKPTQKPRPKKSKPVVCSPPLADKPKLLLGEGFLDSDAEPNAQDQVTPANQRHAVKRKLQLLKIPAALNRSFELAIPSAEDPLNSSPLHSRNAGETGDFFGFSSYLR